MEVGGRITRYRVEVGERITRDRWRLVGGLIEIEGGWWKDH